MRRAAPIIRSSSPSGRTTFKPRPLTAARHRATISITSCPRVSVIRITRAAVHDVASQFQNGGSTRMSATDNDTRIYRGLKDVYFERSATTFIDGKAGELRYRG